MSNFLSKSFEEQVNKAIEVNDAKLIQVLLGAKYCQLWQYWLAHGIISSRALNMERITQAKLFLSIIGKQEKVLQEQKKLLEERKTYLNSDKEGSGLKLEENIKKSRYFVRDLLVAM